MVVTDAMIAIAMDNYHGTFFFLKSKSLKLVAQDKQPSFFFSGVPKDVKPPSQKEGGGKDLHITHGIPLKAIAMVNYHGIF